MKLPTIYIIRHGQTFTNLEQISCGVSETDLTEIGKQQAAQSGEFLRTVGIQKAFVSSLRRTRQTYDALGLQSNIEVEYDSRLWELNFGDYELKPFSVFARGVGMPNVLADWNLRIPGGESVNDVKLRLREFLEEKVAGVDGPVLLVSHGMTSRFLLMVLTAGNEADMLEHDILNCEVWKVEDGNCQRVFTPEL